MEGSVYVDLFATKGIEYLLVLSFLPMLAVFWKFLNTTVEVAPALAYAGATAGAPTPWFSLPHGIFYHQGHTWAEPESDDVVRVGIDDFAQKLVGMPSSLELPERGAYVEQGEKALSLNVDSRSIDVLSPVEGEVVALNEEAIKDPSLINNDPYGNGWLMKVKVPKMKTNLRNLLCGDLAGAWMEKNVDALRARMAGEVGMVLQDGGMPVAGIAKNLSPEGWDDIAKEFLLTA